MTARRRPAWRPTALLPAALLLAIGAATAAFGQNPPPASDDPLFAQTLPADIDTAGAAELRAWLRRLGLPDGGERAALQQRLREHYGLPRADPAPAAGAGVGAAGVGSITVESARSARYRSDELGHTTLVLAGEVAVAAVDRDTGARHAIRADRITYHRERHSLTATGAVVYTVTTEDGAEVFRGESLSVDTERWEGIFYGGTSRVDQQVEETELAFTYSGEAITRRDDDTVVLEQATVTSSEEPSDPHYRIEAERLWVLAPEEWAVRNAFVHIGDVPVLYLPYFLRPGGRLVFHPAFGLRSRSGTYLQTTTYLIGRRPPDVESLSAVPRGAGADRYEDVRRGLFLVPAPASGRPAATSDELALMADLYTRLGVFAGLQGRFGGLSLLGGIAASRALVGDRDMGYTPYRQGTDGELLSHWDTTSILGVQVPLRYGLELDFDRRGELGMVQGSFELFSDPAFAPDFLARVHALPTGGLIGLPQGPLSAPPPRNRLEWRLHGDLALHPLIGAPPSLSTLTLPTLSAAWQWGSHDEVGGGACNGTKHRDADRLEEASPTRCFYYPETLTLPAVAAVAAGSLYRWQADDGAITADVGYEVRPTVSVYHHFDKPVARDQVDLDLRYTRVDTRATGRVTYAASAFDRLVGVDGALVEEAGYQVHTRHADAGEQGRLKSDRDSTSSLLRLDNTLTLRPLVSVPNLSESNVTYGLDLTLHHVRLDADTGDPVERGPTWDRKGVRSHRAAAAAVFAGADLRIRLGAGVDLPPRRLVADGRLETDAGPFSMTLRGMAEQEEGPDPGTLHLKSIDGRAALRIGADASVSQSFLLNERQEIDNLTTEANAYGLTGTVRAERRQPLEPDGNKRDAPPGLRATEVALGYRLDTGALTYWKNRIRLDAGVRTRLAFDPEAYVRDNSLAFDLRLGLEIYRFLELSFESSSVNRRLYRYLPGTAAQSGEGWVNPIVDLARSFNFFNDGDRRDSAFKLESLRVAALHRLGDWNLTLAYQGRPEQQTVKNPDTGREEQQIVWTPALSIEVRWVPVPELYGSFHADRDGIDIGGIGGIDSADR